MTAERYVAIDLGAESGRVMIGRHEGGRLALEELHRFPTGPVRVGDSLHWDVLRFWSEIQEGLAKAARQHGDSLASVGLDTWGVDFGLLADDDTLIGNPYHYRDRRTDGMLDAALRRVPRAEIYEQTGVQFMQINSLYQLYAMAQAGAPALQIARSFLTIPDLFNFWLSGQKANEFTIATTTQCFNPRRGGWAVALLERLDIPPAIFGPIVQPGSVLGALRSSVAHDAGCSPLPLVAVGCHDTASAVAAVPAEGADFIFLSSGTWSLIGVELERPLISEASLAYDFTNEGGLNGAIRFLKNIMGMWLLQECRREWTRQGRGHSYDELTALAAAAEPLAALLPASDPRFLAPGDMPERIQAYCRETGQPVPGSEGAVARSIFESLALEYRWAAERLEELLGRRLPVIHIIGGGSRNRLLNQLTADATGRVVVAGPVEATAIGNVLAQALALGHVGSLAEGRALVSRSFDVATFEPGARAAWDEAYERYLRLKAGG